MSSPASSPTRIGRRDSKQIVLDWADGHSTVYSAAELRRQCPCAHCVHELTGEALLDPASVPDELTQSDVRLVGNYAIAVQFSDGHNTGIYSFPYLRANDPTDPGTQAGTAGAGSS